MLIDACLYAGEADLLRLRLDTLRDVVARFVVVEGVETFSGAPKELALLRSAVDEHYDRLTYHVAPPLSEAPSAWAREAYQRNQLVAALGDVPDTAWVLISDVDEIPDPASIPALFRGELGVFGQSHHSYDARNVRAALWRGTVVTQAGLLRRIGAEGARRQRLTAPVVGGGWHFTQMGSAARLRRKIQAFSHQEYNTPAYLAEIERRRAAGDDLFGREDEIYTWREDVALPVPLRQHPERYPMLWRDQCPAIQQLA